MTLESPRIWSRDEISRRVKDAVQSPAAFDQFCRAWREQRRLRDAAGRSPFAIDPPAGVGPSETPRAVRVFWWIVGTTYAAFVLGAGSLLGGLGLFVGVALVPVVAIVVTGLARTNAYAGDVGAARRRRCVRCGFDLAGLRGPSLPGHKPLNDLGPERCPECGLLWPQLPRMRSELITPAGCDVASQ